MKNERSKVFSLNRKVMDNQKLSAQNREKLKIRVVRKKKKGFSHSLQALVDHFSSGSQEIWYVAEPYELKALEKEDNKIEFSVNVERTGKTRQKADAQYYRTKKFEAFINPIAKISYVGTVVPDEKLAKGRVKKPQTDEQVIAKYRTSMRKICRARKPVAGAITESFNTLIRLSLEGHERGKYSDVLDSKIGKEKGGTAFIFSIDASKASKLGERGDKGEVSICGFSWWPCEEKKDGRLYVRMPNNQDTLESLGARIISAAVCKRDQQNKEVYCQRSDRRIEERKAWTLQKS